MEQWNQLVEKFEHTDLSKVRALRKYLTKSDVDDINAEYHAWYLEHYRKLLGNEAKRHLQELEWKRIAQNIERVSDTTAMVVYLLTVERAKALFTKWGEEMPQVKLTLAGTKTCKRDCVEMAFIDLCLRRKGETKEQMVERALDAFLCHLWFYNHGVAVWRDVHGVNGTATAGNNYKQWVKQTA